MTTAAMLAAHPLADRFPMLPADELDLLAADIAENGLRAPITLDVNGLILDGRNRYAACQSVGIEPTFTTYDGDAAAFVLSANVARRHMSTGARAMATALVLADAGKRADGRWARGSVLADPQVSGWPSMVARAGMILDHAPDLAEQVVDGSLALDAAYRKAERVRDAEREALAEQEHIEAEESDARARLAEVAPDYLAGIGSEYRTARQAFTAWEDDNRREAARLRQERAEAERRARADRDNEVQAASSLYGCLIRLEHLSIPERRAYDMRAATRHASEVPPAQRPFHSPDYVAALAGWLNAYAAELKEYADAHA